MINKIFLMTSLSAILCFQVLQAGVTGLFNTGTTPILTNDPYWIITSAPTGAGPARVVIPNGAWVPDSLLSKWIGPAIGTPNAPVGFYTYNSNFTVTSPIDLSFSYSADNILSNVTLTGPDSYNQSGIFGTSYNAMSPLVDIGVLNPGAYSISFTVFNGPVAPFQGPTGFRAEFTTIDVPEPTTYASLGAMLLLGALVLRRKNLNRVLQN